MHPHDATPFNGSNHLAYVVGALFPVSLMSKFYCFVFVVQALFPTSLSVRCFIVPMCVLSLRLLFTNCFRVSLFVCRFLIAIHNLIRNKPYGSQAMFTHPKATQHDNNRKGRGWLTPRCNPNEPQNHMKTLWHTVALQQCGLWAKPGDTDSINV